jgi:hypothetical protein
VEQAPSVNGAAVAVRVRVLDWRGKPAVGVPVGLGAVGKPVTGPRVTHDSDTDGLVAFGKGEFVKANEAVDSIYVCAIGPLHPLPRTELRLSELPPEPVELRLPPCGSVRVRFDSLGSGLEGDGVSLSVRDVSNDPFPVRNSAKGTLREGEALFALVGLDHELTVTVSVRGANVWPSKSFDGPRADGQEVVVEVPIITTGTLAGFRLIDEKANVLGSRDLEFRIESESGRGSSSTSGGTKSTAEGFIYLHIHAEDPPPDQRTLQVHLGKEAIEANFDLPRVLKEGVTMFGDLQLTSAPILAEGRVIDESGEGIGGARVSIPMHDVDGVTEVDGTFVLRGTIDAPEFDVSVDTTGFIPAGAPRTRSGARGLQIRMLRGARLEGRIETAIEGLDAHLALVLRERGESRPLRHHVRPGAYAFDKLKPGTYDISIHLTGHVAALQRWPGRELVAGKTETLPELDLDALARIVKLRILDPQGRIVRDARVLVNQRVDDGDVPIYEGVRAKEGVATLVLGAAPVELIVLASEFAPTALVPTREQEDVTLETGPRLVIIPTHRLDLPRGTQIEVLASRIDLELPRGEYSFRSGGGTSRSRGSSPVPSFAAGKLDAHGAGEITLSGYGRHELRAVLRTSSETGAQRIPLEGVIDGEFVAARGVAVVQLALNLDDAKVAELLGRDR